MRRVGMSRPQNAPHACDCVLEHLKRLALFLGRGVSVEYRAREVLAQGPFSDQAGHFGSSWPGGGERPPIRYEDSWGGLRGPSDTQLLIYSYIKR